jgi:catechol 2,3-dioxygenase-like lactoylglutathione lyase family enzyme
MIKIKGIAWAGTKTDNYEETAKFFKDVLGFKVLRSDKDITVYRLPNDDVFEVIGPTQAVELNELVKGPKVDFLVDDVRETRREMEQSGVKFEGPVYDGPIQSWTNFHADDGHLYGLTDMHGHPDHEL